MSIRTCPKCHGQMMLQDGEFNTRVWVCIQCGKELSPGEIEGVEVMEKQHEVEANSIKEPEVASESINQPEAAATPEPEAPWKTTRRESLDAARKLRGNKCRTCGHSYEHDEQHWCSQKKCPSRIPERNRLVYRPLPQGEGTLAEVKAFHKAAKPPGESPSATKVDKGDHGKPTSPGTCTVVVAPNIELPDFPAFDNTWPEMVQLRWLDTYRELVRR